MSGGKLPNGVVFPEISAHRVGGGTVAVPDGTGDRWRVVIFYRGHW